LKTAENQHFYCGKTMKMRIKLVISVGMGMKPMAEVTIEMGLDCRLHCDGDRKI